MQNTGTANSTALTISVLVIVLIALGVWWYTTQAQTSGAAPVQNTSSTGTGELEGTVR